jgi:hypothetical protein
MPTRAALAVSIIVGCYLVATSLAAAELGEQGRYPLVFDSPNQLKHYGIGFRGIGTDDVNIHFPTRCYYYGDGGWDISISNALLSTYKSQGFSRRSACMALVSGVRFNPENGKRLATYGLIDRKLFTPDGQPADAGSASAELPLSLPNCFKRGLPYSDCVWNFDPKSGMKLSAEQTAKFKAIGQRIEKFISDPKTKAAFSYLKSDSKFTLGTIRVGAQYNADGGEGSAATFYDYSTEFPKGFGYALYADGEAAPDASPAVVKAVQTGKKPPSQMNANQIKQILTSGIQ